MNALKGSVIAAFVACLLIAALKLVEVLGRSVGRGGGVEGVRRVPRADRHT